MKATPGVDAYELVKILPWSYWSFFPHRYLGWFDTILVAIEQYRDSGRRSSRFRCGPGYCKQDVGALDAPKKANGPIIWSFGFTPLFRLKKFLAFIVRPVPFLVVGLFNLSFGFWAERFFLLGIQMQPFSLDYKLGPFLKSSGRWPTTIFQLYAGVYMLVTCFFLL